MRCKRVSCSRIVSRILPVALLLLHSTAYAQFGGGFGFGFGNGGNNGGLGGAAGIVIDADGIVALQNARPLSPAALKKQVSRYAQEKLPASLIAESPQRVVSLKNLESTVAEHLGQKKDLPIELVCLAGLQRIDAVAFDPEEHDVFLIGPAGPFGPDSQGRAVGATSGRPTLLLEDLITAMRAADSNEGTIGCSLDPTPENLQALQAYLRQNSTPAGAAQVQQRFRAMAAVLGHQQISIWGVPENSHFARALIEADIRMKRMALGVDPPGVPGIRTHLSLLKPQGNSLQRWWFVPSYEPLETNADRTVFYLKGPRAKLLSQDEIADSTGRRSNAATTKQSTEKFAQLFTEHFQELADRSPPFAELQNLYDLAVVAALIKLEGRKHLPADAFPVLMSESRLPLPGYAVAKSIPSASTFRSAGPGTILGLVGGVTMDIQPVVRETRIVEGPRPQNFQEIVRGNVLFGDAPSP